MGYYDQTSNEFKYVRFQVKEINKDGVINKSAKSDKHSQLLIQIVDVSHQKLYSDIKSEQFLSQMINATVSHELRNPLNSLIG
jgi:signal transduction histidine kinase